MYADDSSLFSTLQGTDNGNLQEDLAKLEVWAVENDVIFNADKTKEVLFSKARNIMPLTNLTYFGRDVEQVTHHRHLGKTLPNKILLFEEISIRTSKINKLMNMRRPLK
jgi:hypothetical protein